VPPNSLVRPPEAEVSPRLTMAKVKVVRSE